MSPSPMLNWTNEQLQKALEANPALRVNEKYSQPLKSVKRKISKASRIVLQSMRFYEVERPVTVFLPFTYPSLNRLIRMNRWERRRQEEEFRDAVRWELALNHVLGFRSPVALEVTVYRPVLRHRDRDNYCYKWLKDAMKGIVFVDDDPRYVLDRPVEFARGKEHIEVRIIPIQHEVVAQ